MGILRVISKRGDDRVRWHEQDGLVGDPLAIAAIAEAERRCAPGTLICKDAFSLNPGKPVERLEQFEPQAEQIIMTPRVVGG